MWRSTPSRKIGRGKITMHEHQPPLTRRPSSTLTMIMLHSSLKWCRVRGLLARSADIEVPRIFFSPTSWGLWAVVARRSPNEQARLTSSMERFSRILLFRAILCCPFRRCNLQPSSLKRASQMILVGMQLPDSSGCHTAKKR